MTKLQDLAQTLAQLYKRRAEANIELSHCKADLAGRQTAIVPVGGWLADQAKPTVDQRKQAAETAYAQDDVCQKITLHISDLTDELTTLGAQIDGTQELTKAERWTIRQNLATVLQAHHVETSDDRAPGDDGFDDALDHALDHATDAALNDQADFNRKVAQAHALAQAALNTPSGLKLKDGTPVSPAALSQAVFPSEAEKAEILRRQTDGQEGW